MDVINGPVSAQDRLSAEVWQFLVGFAGAFQKHTMYPAGHPVLRPSVQAVAEHLGRLVPEQEGALRIRVGADRLSVKGASTPPEHPLLGPLARRLHAHRLLTVTLTADASEGELSEFLVVVARDPRRSASALGASGPEQLERWRGILLEPVPYEALSLASGPDELDPVESTAPEEFWERIGSPRGVPGQAGAGHAEGGELQSQATGPEPTAYDRLVEDQLPRILEAWEGGGEDGEAVRQGVSQLILSLRPDQLSQLLRMARTSGDGAEPTTEPDEEASGDALQRLMEATEDVSAGRVPIWLVRLLTKIGMYAESAAEAPGSRADGSMLQLVEQLSTGWEVSDAKPGDYEEALGRLLNATPVLETGRSWIDEPRPERIVQIGLEVEEIRGAPRRAAAAMLQDGRMGELLDLLEDAPVGSPAAESLWDMVARPEQVRRLLQEDPPDFSSLDRILPRIGLPAADPMLDALVEASSRSTRRELFNRLAAMGPAVGPPAVARLQNDRWYARRNMLALLDRLEVLPEGFSPAPYLKDPEPRVRHEAVKLALRFDHLREAAIVVGLNEKDERTIAAGLAAAAEGFPGHLLAHVIRHVLNDNLSPTTRVHGVRALAARSDPRAVKALVQLTRVRRWLFWHGLPPKSPLMLEALRALAATAAPRDRAAQRILRRARRSADPDVRAAAVRGGGLE